MKTLNLCDHIILDGAYLEITSFCNSECPYCYNNSGSKGSHLEFEWIQAVLDEVCKENTAPNFVLSGGEPTLHPDFAKVLEHLSRKNISARVITNGSRLWESEIAESILPHEIQITVESTSESLHNSIRGKNNFFQLKKAVAILKERDYHNIIMRVNLSKRNDKEINNFIQLALDWGCKEIYFAFLQLSGRAEMDSEVISFQNNQSLAESIICEIDQSMIEFSEFPISIQNKCKPKRSCILAKDGKTIFRPKITPDGSVYPCEAFYSHEFLLGNIKQQSIRQIMESSALAELIQRLERRTEEELNCGACSWKSVCGRGCPASAFDWYHTLESNSGECSYFKKKYLKKLLQSNRK